MPNAVKHFCSGGTAKPLNNIAQGKRNEPQRVESHPGKINGPRSFPASLDPGGFAARIEARRAHVRCNETQGGDLFAGGLQGLPFVVQPLQNGARI